MLEGGCDIFSLSKMMGHSAITTTTIYLAASAEQFAITNDKTSIK
jgi:site-specific recombinase XerD